MYLSHVIMLLDVYILDIQLYLCMHVHYMHSLILFIFSSVMSPCAYVLLAKKLPRPVSIFM